VVEGDPVENWTLTNNAELILEGGATDWVMATESTVRMTGGEMRSTGNSPGLWLANSTADIVGATVVATSSNASNGGRGLMVDNVWNNEKGSAANVRDSLLSGYDAGASVTNFGQLNVSASTLRGTGASAAALRSYGGTANFTDGSVLVGQREGVHFGARRGASEDSTFTLDNSSLESITGSALMLNYDAVAHITLRNGATVAAGNGVLLEVDSSAVAHLNADSVALVGDIVSTGVGNAHVALNDASLTGRMTGAGDVALTGASQWKMTDDSDITTLQLANGSVLSLGDGSRFHTLRVSGNANGTGGTLLFNAALGDDGSARDRMHVQGATAGQFGVAVINIGGEGAHTREGIELITVDGASDGQFELVGRAVGGQYEYFLVKGSKSSPDDGNWYLRSEAPTVPDPCDADPSLPGCGGEVVEPPVPVLRPEAGAYLANQAAAVGLFQHRYHDRNGDAASAAEGTQGWVRVTRNQADYGVIGDQLQVNADSSVLHVGSDVFTWGPSQRMRAGVMLAAGQANNTVASAVTGYAAKGKVRGTAAGVYGTWTQQPDTGERAYVDGWLQHGRYRNSVTGDGLQQERYDARSTAASLEAGYAWKMYATARSALYLEPQVQLGWTHYRADQLTERNGTVVAQDRAGGVSGRAGMRLHGVATGAGNQVAPFLALNWLRGDADNRIRFDGERMAGGVPQNRYELNAGAQLQFGTAWSAWGDMALQRGDGGYRNVGMQLGLRRAW